MSVLTLASSSTGSAPVSCGGRRSRVGVMERGRVCVGRGHGRGRVRVRVGSRSRVGYNKKDDAICGAKRNVCGFGARLPIHFHGKFRTGVRNIHHHPRPPPACRPPPDLVSVELEDLQFGARAAAADRPTGAHHARRRWSGQRAGQAVLVAAQLQSHGRGDDRPRARR